MGVVDLVECPLVAVDIAGVDVAPETESEAQYAGGEFRLQHGVDIRDHAPPHVLGIEAQFGLGIKGAQGQGAGGTGNQQGNQNGSQQGFHDGISSVRG